MTDLSEVRLSAIQGFMSEREGCRQLANNVAQNIPAMGDDDDKCSQLVHGLLPHISFT